MVYVWVEVREETKARLVKLTDNLLDMLILQIQRFPSLSQLLHDVAAVDRKHEHTSRRKRLLEHRKQPIPVIATEVGKERAHPDQVKRALQFVIADIELRGD